MRFLSVPLRFTFRFLLKKRDQVFNETALNTSGYEVNAMDFRNFIRAEATQGKRVLEIGPSYNPILPKSGGFNVTIMDHADHLTLIEKYRQLNVDTSFIEEVDVVSTDVAYFFQREIKFDLIVASHMIEHTTDIIAFLQNCSSVLSDAGKLALIIPDKRFCFDKYRPLSSAGNAIDAHLWRRTRHIGALYDVHANFVRNRGKVAWARGEDEDLALLHSSAEAAQALHYAAQSTEYVDAHEWVFIPSSFRLLIGDLNATGYVELQEHFFHQTVGCEFFIVLSKEKVVKPFERASLIHAIFEEEAEVNPMYQKLLKRNRELEETLNSLRGAAA